MGSGSSCNKKNRTNKGIQVSPIIEIQPQQSPVFRYVSKIIPSKIELQSNSDEKFHIETNIEDYSSIWDQETKLTSSFQKTTKNEKSKLEHHQTELFTNEKNKKSSNTHDSTHIQSEINGKTEGYIHLSSSNMIDEYFQHLNRIHTELDKKIQIRNEQISNETESVLYQVHQETKIKQQRLLNYAKEQHKIKDDYYHQLLQEYITKLDRMKAEEFVELQNELLFHRDQIFEESQLKIMTVNDQANQTKAKIVQYEQEQASTQIDSIISQIRNISTDDKFQHLGAELLTKTSINTKTDIGTKPKFN